MTSNRDDLSAEKFTGDKTFKVDYHNVGAAFYTDDYVEWLQRKLAQAKEHIAELHRQTIYPERTYTASQIYEARQFTDEDYNELKRNLYPPREKK